MLRRRYAPLVIMFAVGCGGGATTTADSGLFGGPRDSSSPVHDATFDVRDAAPDATTHDATTHDATSLDAVGDGDGDTGVHVDAGGGDAIADAILDGPPYYAPAACNAPCTSTCTGICSAGNCYDVLVPDASADNASVVVDTNSLYWAGQGADGSAFDYTIVRDPTSGTGTPSVIGSYAADPEGGYLITGPVAGGFGGAFFTTQGGSSSGPGFLFGAFADAGMRLLYAPTMGLIFGVAANDGGVYASMTSGTTSEFLRVAIDGGAAKTLYSDSSYLAYGLVVNQKSFASIILHATDRSYAGVVTGALDGSTPLLQVAQGTDVGSDSLAVDATYVYWGGPPTIAGYNYPTTIYRAPISGGPKELVVHDDLIDSFAVDSTNIYWAVTHPTGPSGSGSAFTYSQAKTSTVTLGGPITLLGCQDTAGIIIDSTYVYVDAFPSISRLPK